MGTSWSVSAAIPRGFDQATVAPGIQRALDGVVAQMSNWETESDISRFNRSTPGQWQRTPAAFAHVLATGLDIAKRSEGAFDPAIGRTVDHWGFGPQGIDVAIEDPTGAPPAPVAQAWRSIAVKGDRARRTSDVTLDFSGIAKGYGVDAVAAWLRGWGIGHFLVEVGGELCGWGVKPDGQPWWVDLEAPPGIDLPVMRVALCGLSIATSGDYRRVVERDGKRWSHSIDPRTGNPVDNGVRSVSILHESCMVADAWATAVTVLGMQAGLQRAADEGLAALMVTDDGREWMTPEFARMLEE